MGIYNGTHGMKKVLCSFPPALIEKVDEAAKHEHRSRTDFIRESVRYYLEVRTPIIREQKADRLSLLISKVVSDGSTSA